MSNYIVIPRSLLQSCSDATQRAFHAALALIRGEERANLPEAWPGRLHVRVRLQDPENGRFLKDDLADYERGRRRLWPQESE